MAHVQRLLDRAAQMRIGSMVALLLLLLINVFVVPFTVAPDGVFARIARDVLLSLILLSGVAAVSDHRLQFTVAALVAGVAILVRWSIWLFPPEKTPGFIDETTLFSLSILSGVIGIKVFSGGTVTFDRILGAVALYIMIGVIWAEAYQLVGIRVAGAFAGITHTGVPVDHSNWIYFSFVTLTTVGYGDITPVAQAARSLSIFEALIGQLYPAIVLARLVSLHAASEGSGTGSA
jgi:hypothetical protein